MIRPSRLIPAVGFCFLSLTAHGQQRAVLLGLGDSIGEAVQSADASAVTQPWSYLNLVAFKLRAPFPLPLIRSGPLGVVGDTRFRSRIDPRVLGANLAVAGADVSSILDDRAEGAIQDEKDLVLFPRRGSQIDIAEATEPTLLICWIGNNDALSAALRWDDLDGTHLTSIEEFTDRFNRIAERLSALDTKVVFGNIPDVTRIGFLLSPADLRLFLGSDFGLPAGSYTSVPVMLLLRLGLVGPEILQNPDFVLSPAEIGPIQERIQEFNRIIAAAAASINAPVVDLHGFFERLVATPPRFFGISVKARFLGGVFSLDGVHPSNLVQALLANEFLKALNQAYGVGAPLFSATELSLIFLSDPFMDKDGDLRVPGRPGAGLLETLAPILGLSGDWNDWLRGRVQTGVNARAGRDLDARYRALTGAEARALTATDWVSRFKRIFGMPEQP